MRIALLIACLGALTVSASAEPVPQPTYQPNDMWSYHVTLQLSGHVKQSDIRLSVRRVGEDGIVVDQIAVNAPDLVNSSMYGLDWSRRKSVNGQETTINRPFAFPLDVGKSWIVKYTELNPTPQKLSETDTYPYKVIGWEDVTVPAGTFHALKIEANGKWEAVIAAHVINNAVVMRQGNAAAQSSEHRLVHGLRATGRYYSAFWYVPKIKRWVKAIEESYASNESLTQSISTELENYAVDGKPAPEMPPAKPNAAPPASPVAHTPPGAAKDAI